MARSYFLVIFAMRSKLFWQIPFRTNNGPESFLVKEACFRNFLRPCSFSRNFSHLYSYHCQQKAFYRELFPSYDIRQTTRVHVRCCNFAKTRHFLSASEINENPRAEIRDPLSPAFGVLHAFRHALVQGLVAHGVQNVWVVLRRDALGKKNERGFGKPGK